MIQRCITLAAACLSAFACSTLSAAEQPALIAQPSPQSRAELLAAVTAAFNGQPIVLADDALTRESLLIIERREPRDAEGRPVGGRTLATPEQFDLVLRDSQCELVRRSDGRRWLLTRTICVPNPTTP
jgi:hypothetical protein